MPEAELEPLGDVDEAAGLMPPIGNPAERFTP
jgi:hypothetical protein